MDLTITGNTIADPGEHARHPVSLKQKNLIGVKIAWLIPASAGRVTSGVEQTTSAKRGKAPY